MMLSPELLASIATDPRLTPDAVRVILYLSTLGEVGEELDVKGEDLSILLHGGEKPIRAAIKRAEHCGYVRARHGGRAGHKLTLMHAAETVNKSLPEGSHLGNDAPQGGISGLNHSPRGGISPLVVEEGEDTTPYSPPAELEPTAAAVVEAASVKLAGCRGALRDYVAARVPLAQQYGYVQSVVTWLDNPAGTFRGPDGAVIPPADRVTALATALNELLATNEGTRKYGTGDPANLRTKLQAVLAARSPPRTNGARGGRRPIDQQTYQPTTDFTGFNL